jgi:hypothetical protein
MTSSTSNATAFQPNLRSRLRPRGRVTTGATGVGAI